MLIPSPQSKINPYPYPTPFFCTYPMQIALVSALVETLPKEALPGLRFSHHDVLSQPADRLLRRHNAERAVTLGNAYHGKLDIYFQTADGTTKRVQTTVWAADGDHLTFKSGVLLPLRAVVWMDFY